MEKRSAHPPSSSSSAPALALAWSVHLLTASGAVFGAFALIAIATERFAAAAMLMLVTLAIDSVDGTLARRLRVAEVVPVIDGRRLDDMVDYLNFVIVPAMFMVADDQLLSPYWIAAPILASCYGFSRTDAKTDDGFFLGFPSYWNVLALYLWMLDVGPLGGTLWTVFLAIGVFVPFKYLYPSKLENPLLRWGISAAGLVWAIWLGGCALELEAARTGYWIELSLFFPILYLVLSFVLGGFQAPVSSKRPQSPGRDK